MEWKLVDQTFGDYAIEENGKMVIALTNLSGNYELAEKRAKLIAAAPDMLAALQNLENDAEQVPAHAWKIVQDAINRATGKP